MSRIAYSEKKDVEELHPGDYFDLIGGTGFGAYTATMLGMLHMTLDEAIDAILNLANSLFSRTGSDTVATPEENLRIVKDTIGTMLKSRGIPVDIKLNDKRLRASKCKVTIASVLVNNIASCQIFCTYPSRQSSINCTLIEALCTSLVILPLFNLVPIGPQL
ncbi:hypothetical protein CPB86DRAFT_819079 [Serendipita vermifera]|nr:hypothetical protein CPB86DRAFT_819079 [Serendipita vermifera]